MYREHSEKIISFVAKTFQDKLGQWTTGRIADKICPTGTVTVNGGQKMSVPDRITCTGDCKEEFVIFTSPLK